MNTFAMKVSGLVLFVLLAVPTAGAEAYRYVDSSAKLLFGNTYLLTHTYTAGFLNEDVKTPIAASVEYGEDDEYPRVGFAVEGVSNQVGAQINGLVLSTATIENNQYLTTKGERDTFTLIAFITFDQAISGTEDVRLVMRQLPFSYLKDGEEKTGMYELEVADQSDDLQIVVTK